MATTKENVQGVVLALFGAAAGGHLTGLTQTATSTGIGGLAGDLAASAGLIMGKDLSANAAFRDYFLGNLGISTTNKVYLDAANWANEALKTTPRGDVIVQAVTFLNGLTDATSPFYAAASTYRSSVAKNLTWSEGAGSSVFAVSALVAQQGTAGGVALTKTDNEVLLGTPGADSFYAASETFNAADQVIDTAKGDGDSITIDIKSADLGGDNEAPNSIVKIENVVVNYDVISTTAAATGDGFDATNVSDATITVQSNNSLFLGAAGVAAAGSNNVVAGAGVTTLYVEGINADATIDAGAATTVKVDSAEDTIAVIANGGTLSLTTDGAVENLVISAKAATTVKVTDTATPTTIVASGSAVTLSGAATLLDGNTVRGVSTVVLTTAGNMDLANVTGVGSIEIKEDSATQITNATGTTNVTVSIADLALSADAKTAASGSFNVTVNKTQASGTALEIGTTKAFADASVTIGADVEEMGEVSFAQNTTVTVASAQVFDSLANTKKTTLLGTGDVEILDAATSEVGTLDASGLNGSLTIGDFSGKATVTGTAFADTITSTEEALKVIVNLGAGNDTFAATGTIDDGATTVSGGDGDDKITFSDLSGLAATAANTVIANGDAGSDTITVSNADFANGGNTATIKLNGGAGDDTFVYGTTADGEATYGTDLRLTIDGGDGNDTLKLAADSDLSGATSAAKAVKLVSIETVNVTGAVSVDYATLAGITVTVSGTAGSDLTTADELTVVLAETDETVDLSRISTAASLERLIVDLGDVTNGASYTGSTGTDSVTTSGNVDVIATGDGKDTVTVSAEAGDATHGDNIDLGAGDDTLDLAGSTLDYSATKLTVNGGDGADTIKLDGDFTGSAVSITGFETLQYTDGLEVSAALVSGATYGLKATTAAAGTGITVSVSSSATSVDLSGLTATTTNVATTKLDTIVVDASATTGLTSFAGTSAMMNEFTGGTSTVSAVGGKYADTFTLNAGVGALTGGAGNDTFVLDDAAGSTATSLIQITDFTLVDNTGTEKDVLQIGAGGLFTVAAAGWTDLGNGIVAKTGAKVADFVTAIKADMIANGAAYDFIGFVYGDDLYIYSAGADEATGADDTLVRLTGLGTSANGIVDVAGAAGDATDAGFVFVN